jgi:hypothetical protein
VHSPLAQQPVCYIFLALHAPTRTATYLLHLASFFSCVLVSSVTICFFAEATGNSALPSQAAGFLVERRGCERGERKERFKWI